MIFWTNIAVAAGYKGGLGHVGGGYLHGQHTGASERFIFRPVNRSDECQGGA